MAYATLTVQAQDTEQAALYKLAYWLQQAALASGGVDTTTMLLPSMSPNWNDGRQPLLVKAAYWAEQLAGGGGGGAVAGITVAPGDPPIDGSITTLFYKNSTSGVIFINAGTVAVPVWDTI
jgi:hypothetical protein